MTTLLKNSYALGLLLFLWTFCSTRWYSHAFTLRTANTVLRDEFALMMNDDAPVSNGYSLLRSDVRRQHLKVVRSRSAPLHRVHLPIQIRAQKGQVCRVEVEEFQPLLSMVGYLEPKKFDCSFADGEVIYHHQGNPLANHDHVQVTISFFRNNNSVVQTVDIMVDVEDPSTESSPDASLDIISEQSKERAAATDKAIQAQRRVELLDHINVTNLKATSDSITPAVLRFYYDPATEECRLSYTSPDFGAEPDSSHKWSHQGESSVAGTRSPRLGLPLAAGDAVGGMHRWPLFGHLVAFNRSTVNFFDLDCQEALLQGYRYMHRKPNSPSTDYLPLQVVIWRREPDGTRTRLWREGVFLKVTIVNGQPLKRPMALIFRQVNVTHIGGSLSVLPRDSVSVPQDAVPGLEYLDVNMTQMQGPLQAQIVNLRDPTRPVTSFRMLDLRRGLIALQLLNYAESLVKVFVITLTVVDPFFQVSAPVNLRIATFLQPVVHVGVHNPHLPRAPSFQVFSLPLFTYTGAVSLIQKHNIQVVGYIDESMVVYTVQPWLMHTDPNQKPERGALRLDGESYSELMFGPLHIAVMRLTYVHTGGYEPTVERIPLTVSVPSLTNLKQLHQKRYVREAPSMQSPYTGRRESRKRRRGQKRLKHRKRTIRSRMQYDPVPETHLELSVRIVRLYDKVTNGALKSGALIRLAASSHVCFKSEDLLTPDALQAIRSDLVNLEFIIKMAPSQGSLVRRFIVDGLAHYEHPTTGWNKARRVATEWPVSMGVEENRHKPQQLLERASVSKISVEDLEAGDICYQNQKYDRPTDLIGIKQLGRHDFPTFYINIEILPPIPLVIEERMDPNVLVRVRETATHVVIGSLHLNHALKQIPYVQPFLTNISHIPLGRLSPEDLVYHLIAPPRFTDLEGSFNHSRYPTHDAGRLVSMKAVTASTHVGDMTLRPSLSTSLREAQAPCVAQFTQHQIDVGDIVYVPPVADIGVSDKFVSVHYTVTGPGGVRLVNRQLRILIVAEDNQIPKIEIVKPLEVQRDGELILGPEVLSISDPDTTMEQLTIRFDRLPRYGEISLSTSTSNGGNQSVSVPATVGQNLPISFLHQERIRYRQSGANVKSDDFILTATDPKQSSQSVQIGLQIKPRVLQESKWNQMVNSSVLIEENSTITLHPAVFPDVDPGVAESSTPRYFLIVFPTKGHLELGASRRVSQFSHADVSKGRLVYRHGPAEIGLKPAFDFARIWDFSAGTTFSLNFTLIPVNSQPPVVRAEAPIRVKEGDRSLIDQYTLYASDADTAEKDIQLQLIHPPRWGHIGIMDVNTTEKNISHTEAELSQTLTFSMQALKDGRVFYVNSLHGGGQESVEDVFTVRAFDGKFYSPHTVEVKIAIQPTNDENPDVRLLRHFSVTAGSRRILTPYLFSVSDKDVPRDMLQIQFTQLPAYGRLTVFWQHGERYVLSKDSPPITESYLGMMNLLYLQNASTISTHMVATNGSRPLAVDCFMVSVSDGLHVVEKQANILIRPTNRYPPEMTVDASIPNGLTLEGVAWITLDKKPGGLIIADRDTSADDLIVTLVEAPKYGVIQRLPRLDGPDGVDVLDLIEAAWDIEELAVGGDAQELARLSAAGSVGGPKAVKTLHQGDRFTKRQIDTERIHYVYTGTYSEQTVYDSCVVRLSDGEYDTAAVTLRFQIRRTADRAGLQSLRYSPSDPLRSYQLPPHDSNYLRTMIPKMDELNLAIAPYPDDKHPQHQMDQSELVDPIRTAVPLPTWDACVEQHSFLTYQMFLSSLPTWNGTYATDEVRVNANISLFTSSGYNFTVDGRTQPMSCGHFVNARRPQQAINQFSTDELANRLIAFAANGCKDYIDQVVNAVLKIVFDFSQHPTYATLPIRITKKCRQLPRLKQVRQRLEVLPGTDVVVSRKHLEFIDPDSDPTRLVYAIADPFSTGSTHTFGGLQVIGSGATHFFTQYQVNTGQVYFRTNKQLNAQGTAELQVIEIHLFDAGDLGDITNDNDMFQVAKDALSVLQHLGTAETNPYSERMQYVADAGSKVISIRPIMLSISPSPLIQMLNSMNQFIMLTTTPPAPNALETIMPGKVGFRLTAEHLYSSKSDAMYRLVGVSNGKGELFHIKLNRSVTSFVQEDIGRRRMAFLLVSRAGWQDLNTSQKQKRTKTALTEEGLQFEVYDPNEPQEKLRVSMLLQWMEIGISRRVYRVCGTRGLLRVGVERFGSTEVVKNFSADVHVGLTSSTAVDGLDFRLHSPKTVIFQKGETRKAILIRVHLRNDSLGTTHEVIVNLKSPTGAILSSKRQARVIISSSPQCKHRPYFSPQKHENPVKRDLEYTISQPWSAYTKAIEGMSADDSGVRQPNAFNPPNTPSELLTIGVKRPISLKEWLATNKLPDSQTLSASYQEFMQKRQTSHCQKGWNYYQSRCYRWFTKPQVSWKEAEAECQSRDAFLTSVHSEAHSNWLITTYHPQGAYWIGLHQPSPWVGWTWHNLERVDFTKWSPGFPVNTRWTEHLRRARSAHFDVQRNAGRTRPFRSSDSRLPMETSFERAKRRYTERHRSKRSPRTCVLVNPLQFWQNRPCDQPIGVGFVCMKNPEA